MKNPIGLEDKLLVGILLCHLNAKKDFPSNRHLPQKKTYFVRFLCHVDFVITKIDHLC